MPRESSLFTNILIGASSTVAVALVLRAIKRRFSPTITCRLKCQCGAVQGEIRAKHEDSIRIYCFCQDCRDYAKFCQSQSKNAPNTIGMPCGDNRVVQVCKNAVTLHQGQEQLQLALKAPPNGKDVFMHRFYAKCCGSPLFNTVDFLGFVGVFTDFLDATQLDKFDGPVALFPEHTLHSPIPGGLGDISAPQFLWKLARYAPYRKSGPFDYSKEPKYWGKQDQESKKDS